MLREPRRDIVGLFDFGPVGPLVEFTVVVGIDADADFHLFHPGSGADIVGLLLCEQVETTFREADVGVRVSFADLVAPGVRSVDVRTPELADTHVSPAGRIVIPEQIVL